MIIWSSSPSFLYIYLKTTTGSAVWITLALLFISQLVQQSFSHSVEVSHSLVNFDSSHYLLLLIIAIGWLLSPLLALAYCHLAYIKTGVLTGVF